VGYSQECRILRLLEWNGPRKKQNREYGYVYFVPFANLEIPCRQLSLIIHGYSWKCPDNKTPGLMPLLPSKAEQADARE
jgi:hypothetical protein